MIEFVQPTATDIIIDHACGAGCFLLEAARYISGKVCLIVLQKGTTPPDHQIFMAEAKWCGHDSRARDIPNDDMPSIIKKFKAFKAGHPIQSDRYGFIVPHANLRRNILTPRFSAPVPVRMVSQLKETHELLRIADLVKGDPKHTIAQEVYEQYAAKQDVQAGDMLMVRDGTYLIGTCAFISPYDTQIVFQSHLYKIRVRPNSRINSYLLLAILASASIVYQSKVLASSQAMIDSRGNGSTISCSLFLHQSTDASQYQH